MIAVQNSLFNALTETSKEAVNEFIEFLYHKEISDETRTAVNDALTGNTIGPFNNVSELMADLYADD